MSRTYANFILFENVLDTLVHSQDPIVVQYLSNLLNPVVKIVENDCGTLLGESRETSYELEGLVETATGDRLTATRITSILNSGKYYTNLRTLGTCLSHTKGGICRKCYSASVPGSYDIAFNIYPPVLGSVVTVQSQMPYQTDIIQGDGLKTTFILSQNPDQYYSVYFVNQDHFYDLPSGSSINGNTLTFSSPPPAGNAGRYVIHFYDKSAQPFQGYISQTYSGALLGMKPLRTTALMMRKSIYEDQFSDSSVGLLLDVVSKIKTIPDTHLEFINRIHPKLEKIIFSLFLYAIFSNVKM